MVHPTATDRRAETIAAVRSAVICCCALAVMLLGAGCAEKERSSGETERPAAEWPNILLVTLDTTRVDHCSCYGYTRNTTPNLDALAKRGVRFETAYTVMPTTSPAHATLLTSQYPDVHTVVKNGYVMPDHIITMAEILRAHGYATAAFVSAFTLDGKFGLSQGFDVYDDATDQFPDHIKVDRPAGITTARALAWLKDQDVNQRYFLWVHYFDPHEPYAPPEPYRSQFARPTSTTQRDHIIDRYDGEIRYMDDQLGRLLAAVEARPSPFSTMTIVASDHGEGLMDHGWLRHGVYLYEELVHVVLLFQWEGHIPGGRVQSGTVGLIDVLPTVLTLLDLNNGDLSVQGLDLSALWRDEKTLPDDRPMFMQRRLYEQKKVFDVEVAGEKRAVRSGRWKLIVAPEEGTTELYDLYEDPGELHNLAAGQPAQVARLRKVLQDWQVRQNQQVKPALQQISPEDMERLRSLGYVD